MAYQNDPMKAIVSDIETLEEEIEQIVTARRAVEVILEATPERICQSRFPKILEAARTLNKMDLDKILWDCDLDSMSADQIVTELMKSEEGAREELQSFHTARNELLLWNREQTMKWIKEQIEDCKKTVTESQHGTVVNVAARGRLEALRDCSDRLRDVKAKYND